MKYQQIQTYDKRVSAYFDRAGKKEQLFQKTFGIYMDSFRLNLSGLSPSTFWSLANQIFNQGFVNWTAEIQQLAQICLSSGLISFIT